MSDSEFDRDQIERRLDEKYEEIRELVQALRDIYAIAGEDKEVSAICNKLLENTSITGSV